MVQQSKIKSTKDNANVIEHSKEDTKLKNNRKQIKWCRNKVSQLLLRGNSRSEISRNLHISQPTTSRDIDFNRGKNVTNSKKYSQTIIRWIH
jgi:DNA invertase Pin-like site-specific DNA recombinase